MLHKGKWTPQTEDPFLHRHRILSWQGIIEKFTLKQNLPRPRRTFTSRLVSFWWTSCQYSHRPWTALGRIHPASTSNELQHLLVGFAGVWHVTQREDLPQQYSKWPAGGGTDHLSLSFIIMCNTLNLACSSDWEYLHQYDIFHQRILCNLGFSILPFRQHLTAGVGYRTTNPPIHRSVDDCSTFWATTTRFCLGVYLIPHGAFYITCSLLLGLGHS